MLDFNSVLVGTQQLEPMTRFYEDVIGRAPDHVDDDNGFRGWQVGSAYFGLLRHSEMVGAAKEPGRVMPNFETPDVPGVFERLKGSGAAVVKEPYGMDGAWIATLADPDGNYFQLMSPMEM